MPMAGGLGSTNVTGLDGYSGGAVGDLLGQQVEGETEEMKRRRLLLEQMKEAVNPLGVSGALGLKSGDANNPLGNSMSRFARAARSRFGGGY